MATNLSDSTSAAIHLNLGTAVGDYLESFQQARSQAQAKSEAAFQDAVASNTLNPDAQVAYRQSMLDKAMEEYSPDQDYITDLKTKLASAKVQAHNSDVMTKINADKAQVAGAFESNQTYLGQLQDLLNNENDPQLKSTLQSEITAVRGTMVDNQLKLISTEQSKAISDKSTTELNKALDDASNQKASFLAIGDQTNAELMDATINNIKQNLVNIKIDDENNGLNINKAVDSNPLGYLQNLKNLIATSDTTTPIIYYGVGGSLRQMSYESEQAYWQAVLGNYLNTSFIGDITKQYSDYVNNAAVVNKLIPNSVLDSLKSDFAQLSADPDLAPYVTQLQQTQVQIMGDAVAKNAAAIVDNYKNVDQDANSALGQLDDLSQKYGIDVTAYTNQIVAGAAKQTSAGISAINTAATQYENQGSTPDDALKQAISDYQSGKLGAVQSNKQLATETPTAAVSQPPETAKPLANTPQVTTPIPDNNNPNPAQQQNEPSQSPGVANGLTKPVPNTDQLLKVPATPKFTSFSKTSDNATVYGTDANGQTVAFENEDQLKQAGGTSQNIKIIKSAPSGAVNYSQYNPSSSVVTPAINP